LIDFSRPRSAVAPPPAPVEARGEGARRIKVAVVDDSVVVRGLVSRWIGEERDLELAGTYRTGVDAVAGVVRTQPDAVILDIEMPDMDGLTALPLLLKLRPGLVVIMASTLTVRNADISLKCLQLGAADYVPKPSTHRELSTSMDFRNGLIARLRSLLPLQGKRPIEPDRAAPASGNVVAIRPAMPRLPDAELFMRPMPRISPRAILIGASTGGPQAIMSLSDTLRGLAERVPILITQHMPATFTSMFAEHLRKRSGLDAVEAVDGEVVRAGRAYVAPGGRHMRVEALASVAKIRLTDEAPVNFCRPAVDLLYESAASVYGADLVAVTLTGMGTDGLRGAGTLVKRGAASIVQDEESSIVWGMPGAIARAGLSHAVLPISRMAEMLRMLMQRSAA
jgi:two-component system, chemotaxis family, protein-glutamate methylesterase/glutaminase